MTQEDNHRDTSGNSPGEPDNGGTPEAGPPPESGGWAAPGQNPSERDRSGQDPSAPAAPTGGRPEFAPPEQGQPGFAPPGQDPQQHGQQPPGAGYGPRPPEQPDAGYGQQAQWRQPGYGTPPGPPPGHGQQPPYGGQPGYGAPMPPGGPRAPKPGVVSLRPMTLGDILNGAFSLIRHNPKTTVGLSLIVMAIASIVSSIGFSGYMSDYGTFLDQVATDPASINASDPLPFSAWSLIALYGGGLLSQAGIILVTGLLTAVVGMAALGRKLSPSQAWAIVRERIGAVIGLALLQLLIFFGLTLVIMVIGLVGLFVGIFVAVSADQVVGTIIAIASVVLGFGGGLVLSAWIYVRIYFAMPIVVLERLGPGAALARSWRLTQGSWWRIFGIALLATVLMSFVSGLLSTPFSVLSVIPTVLAPGAVWAAVVAGAIIYIGTVLASAITAPFTVGVTTLLYVDLRMRREGLDLRLHEAAQAGHEAGPEIYLPEPRT
ncbi:glycerophosphoryl diester phosphodiesterase membrane domain-containing protein [Nocardiopsis halotolerans]|uniref:glycerophosphoryl diester phosphodiesterase membrane domain-containing protein n=1 Tax=Nocardiopsis halotolerans TaxID=124252 RepID=UPI000475D023|nr:glycerophosphoryl diester phosphodiesterase membrane domain-containing protein [Nocardiopsis halotolerans]